MYVPPQKSYDPSRGSCETTNNRIIEKIASYHIMITATSWQLFKFGVLKSWKLSNVAESYVPHIIGYAILCVL